MRGLLTVSASLLVGAILACAPHQSAADESAHRLNNAELQTLFAGASVRLGEHTQLETYCNGRLSILGGRAPIYGAYEIREAAVCVSLDAGGGWCHAIYQEASGVYRRADPANSSAPQQIAITPTSC